MPTTWRNRLRSEPLPILPLATLLDGIRSVSRPIEGLDSHGAVRTLRTSVWRTNSSASRLRVLTARGLNAAGRPRYRCHRGDAIDAPTTSAVSVQREASAPLASNHMIRRVRTAPKLSGPSMGRDTPPLPTANAPNGRVGRGLFRRRLRHVLGIGGTYTKVSGAARARCVDESPPNAQGNRGRSGPISDGRTPEKQAPAHPADAAMHARNAGRAAPGQAPQATRAAGQLHRRKSEISQQECFGLGGCFRHPKQPAGLLKSTP